MDIKFVQNPEAPLPSNPKPLADQVTTMHLQLETITPELAQQLLDKNTDNRPLRDRHVLFLSNQMKAGAWQITGDPVKVARSGRLLDGQHRLAAIVRSETAQWVYVAWNCEEEIFSVLDTGRNRSSADVLATAGMKNYVSMSAAAKLLIFHERSRMSSVNNNGRQTTNAVILEYVTTHDLNDSATRAAAWAKRCRLLNQGEWVALHYLLSQKNAKQATEFLQQVSTGLNLTEGHPVFHLRSRLQAARDGRFNFTPAERMALTVKAWNAVRNDRKLGQLVWKNFEEFPEII
ncbi:hypothetical protein [Spirosoma utsteinense]|uniref:hypothetical protein n=1 Tax=Spirosoma utsteinense TaxID=2585773 RepID=UPI001646A3E1|nr:hypothetical protein [Spirosoma utsteinense]MBC3785741.1 hypothetical protein [Spirosoma utsteinense]